jgi:glutamyl-tRNA synthetase
MTEPAVVRFAPSPTGPPHLGSLRTALFNWLLARATGGRFILRIDDTDRARYSSTAESDMVEALHWLGLSWDEGPDIGGPHAPYRQSERLNSYHAAAEALVSGGFAYHRADEPGVVRLRTPREGSLIWHDLVRGEIAVRYARIPSDPVLVKTDGYPTYHLATVVDDQQMGITHVLRGEEWIPSTPIHLLIWAGLGGTPPQYAHLPLVTDRQGQKLKKRDPRYLVMPYRQAGFLPQAVMNHLALLGWNPGAEQDIFTPDELVAQFSLARLSGSASAFDEDRLRWFNRQHIARLSPEQLAHLTAPLIRDAYPAAAGRDDAWLARLVALVHDELATLNDVIPAVQFAFETEALTGIAREALASEQAVPVLTALRAALLAADKLDSGTSGGLFRELREQLKSAHGWSGRAVMFPARAALTGTVEGPHLSDVAALLGREECLRRIDRVLSLL